MTPKPVTAMRVSEQIHAIEDDHDALLDKTSKLISEITKARVDHGVDANELQRVISRLVASQTALVESRMKAIGVHSDLRKFATPRADYPFGCPERVERQAEPQLKAVTS